VKAFFDIDWKDRPDLLASEQAQVQFINSVIGHLSRHCGYSSDIRDWSIQQTLHEDKFSIHLVLNDNTHYANCAQLKAHLLACQVDFAHYGIDTHVYATAQLRALGSGKEWDAADFKPKLLRGINHANITFPEFANGSGSIYSSREPIAGSGNASASRTIASALGTFLLCKRKLRTL
jgi:hypothetical protein